MTQNSHRVGRPKSDIVLRPIMQLQHRRSQTPAPFSFAPSQSFEGNDGSWSTFVIRVGTPEQVFHVLISTSSQETWIPFPQGCNASDPADCGSIRGVMPFNGQDSTGFQTNASSTWTPMGFWSLSNIEASQNYTGHGDYGFDTVGLELPKSGGLTLKNQTVAGIATKVFMLGEFGLGPKPTNFSNFDEQYPSWLYSAKEQGLIPSLSWGYTAGAYYQMKQVPGSLTIGGYDASRFEFNDMSFAFGGDDSRPLIVGLQSIQAINTLSGNVSLLETGILSFIDSTIPEIWLPESACTAFENAFGLQFDPQTERYLVNETTRSNLTAMNPSINFTLGNEIAGGMTVFISLPYKAFDLQLSYPLYNTSTNYFPLRRATDATQYTLGRTFLQEAYVVADFERSTFSVSQCVFSAGNPSDIKTILPVEDSVSRSELSSGGIAGVATSVVVFVVASAVASYIFLKSRKAKQAASRKTQNVVVEEADSEKYIVEIHGKSLSELSPVDVLPEMVGTKIRHELPSEEKPAELSGMKTM